MDIRQRAGIDGFAFKIGCRVADCFAAEQLDVIIGLQAFAKESVAFCVQRVRGIIFHAAPSFDLLLDFLHNLTRGIFTVFFSYA
jgi:hypothetical protein